MTSSRSWDIALLGATGFTGALVAEELARVAPPTVRIALAGRNRDKLLELQRRLGVERWGVVIADTAERGALDALAASTKVLCTTVGPYAKHGLPVVEACASAGTHVCDLTGETNFMRRSIDVAHQRATETGARIVHSCGFDSIPSDLGMLVAHEFAKANGLAGSFTRATLALLRAKGGFSGGTVASLLNALEEASADRALRRVMADPYTLSPDHAQEPDLGRQSDQTGLEFDELLDSWTAPFVMASINTRVVRRSNALLGYPYGRALRYRETTALKGTKGLVFGAALTAGLGVLIGSQRFEATKTLMAKALPKPGDGPNQHERDTGFFRMRLELESTEGRRLHVNIAGTKDPGYGETARMLSQSALCLAFDELPTRAGVLTPATAMGVTLVERLRKVGMTFEAKSGAR